jgi:hypothetical protein
MVISCTEGLAISVKEIEKKLLAGQGETDDAERRYSVRIACMVCCRHL